MKTLSKKHNELLRAGRWDIDFHLSPEGIKKYPEKLLKRIDEVADISKLKRDPTLKPEKTFQYIDIASIDVKTGIITNPQELLGEEAPSRARKVVQAFDIVVSTCRPTRGAIAVVPEEMHNQIASTAFSIVRPKENINPIYLHYAIRLQSTLEQFRKWSTGSSYPAILDEDVEKTLIPVPDELTQDQIAKKIITSFTVRSKAIEIANETWNKELHNILGSLTEETALIQTTTNGITNFTNSEIRKLIKSLPSIFADQINGDLFDSASVLKIENDRPTRRCT
ncbi:MAG: restriction endonuclease subunit S [Proteobacteria bacterium]|nr:restriction endonuclease subunit S [Pseudomonadota bacterium]MBU1717196.1 restriction endonuclease subunit S [Pseudomonadota bacterium]